MTEASKLDWLEKVLRSWCSMFPWLESACSPSLNPASLLGWLQSVICASRQLVEAANESRYCQSSPACSFPSDCSKSAPLTAERRTQLTQKVAQASQTVAFGEPGSSCPKPRQSLSPESGCTELWAARRFYWTQRVCRFDAGGRRIWRSWCFLLMQVVGSSHGASRPGWASL